MAISRRAFLAGVAGASGAVLLGRAQRGAAAARLPAPDASGIEHVVVVMMENRSFDHLLGWLPGADGRQAGLVYEDAAGVARPTHALAPDYAGCAHPDPDHSYVGGRTQYNGGRMDGFLRADGGDAFPIGYYGERDRPVLSALARNYTTCDRSFCSFLGPTFPNRLFLHAARTDRTGNTVERARMSTIWDRLARAGVSARYYFSNVPFVALWGLRYLPVSRGYAQFLADAAAGTLPAVSFVDPRFTLGGGDPLGNDDHPHADVRSGEAFLAETFRAVAHGPAWPHTVLVVTYDEWGGFFDHVPPPRAPAPNGVDPDRQSGRALLGFRVPTIVASPWSRGEPAQPRVSHALLDHTSILKLIEWRWRLWPLGRRDAALGLANLARVLDFASPADPDVPDLPEPDEPTPCAPPGGPAARALASPAAGDSPWQDLLDSPLLDGWPRE